MQRFELQVEETVSGHLCSLECCGLRERSSFRSSEVCLHEAGCPSIFCISYVIVFKY